VRERCPVCSICGLNSIALSLNLVRVPQQFYALQHATISGCIRTCVRTATKTVKPRATSPKAKERRRGSKANR
jgi:hypothetical protein